jgi:hypothetical protein
MNPQPIVEPGQVWRPTVPGRVFAKLVVRVSAAGGVYALRYPPTGRAFFPRYFTPDAWQAWADKFGAEPQGRAGSLAGDA